MLVNMIEIDSIHAFEDEAFLKTITRWSVAVAVAGVLLVVPFARSTGETLGAIGLRLPGGSGDTLPLPVTVLIFIGMLIVLTVASLAAHELVHGLFFKLFAPKGSRVYFGVQLNKGMFYACADGITFTRRQYLTAVLAPSFVVTVLCVALGIVSGWISVALFVAALHLSGCTGDWFYAACIAGDKRVVACEDTSWGVRFLGEDPAEGDEIA